jgi:hypothetical protein
MEEITEKEAIRQFEFEARTQKGMYLLSLSGEEKTKLSKEDKRTLRMAERG